MNLEEMTLEEKVDKILKYQIRSARMQMAKTIFSIILFVLFIVLPIVMFVKFIQSADLSMFGDAMNNLKYLNETGANIKGLDDNIDKVSQILEGLGR